MVAGMDALAQLEKIAQQIAGRHAAIQQARDEGYTWEQIAAALQMSRAGAIKLYNAAQPD